ncbi:MAG: UDP-N-acetylglucosamine 2-epimerase (non-hydrolyzing) [Candidatus Aminicenantes bacterium]|nr:MAG: UDP-N-acetylglucosamine 2-epimerase (non-hydrolyzing) [Candidatus Aminicenantes bacterium]
MSQKIISAVGARPNFIKIAPLMLEFLKYPEFEHKLVHTGQHYDVNMSDYFLDDLDIPEPDYNLGVGSDTHAVQTAYIMMAFEKICVQEKPDLVIVVGDVNSTLACSLVAAKFGIKVAHVEAGLRSFDRTMPEEINRIMTDHISDILFCPTETAVSNLQAEGIIDNVFNVGDVMCDVLLQNLKRLDQQGFSLDKYQVEGDYFLATVHRAGNTDKRENLEAIIHAFSQLEHPVLLPLHPRTRKMLKKFDLFQIASQSPNLKIIDPVGYLEMLYLENNAGLIITDSGGIQKEAYLLKKPCVTLRKSTEWVETLGNGNMLAEIEIEKIKTAAQKMTKQEFSFEEAFYGKGDAAEKIGKILAAEWTSP